MSNQNKTYIWRDSKDPEFFCVGNRGYRTIDSRPVPSGWILSFVIHCDALYDLIGKLAFEELVSHFEHDADYVEVDFSLKIGASF